MRDAFGTDGCVLVLGATSDIAAATVRELAASGTRAMTLTARQTADLAPLVDELSEQGVACRTIELDVAATATVGPTLDDLFADADYDLVLCAIGVLDDDERHLKDSDAAYSTITGTFAGPALAVLAAARGLRSQGHGTLATLTRVAAIRPRAGVALYGGAKAGLDFLARGLRPTLREHGVRVLVIRPGFVHTRMTEGLSPAPLSTDPESVARDIVRSLRRSRTVVWTPRLLRPMFAVLRLLPSPIWNRLAAR